MKGVLTIEQHEVQHDVHHDVYSVPATIVAFASFPQEGMITPTKPE